MSLKTISTKDLILADKEVQKQRRQAAVDHLLAFVRYTMPTFQSTQFHNTYYKILNEFVHGRIKKLIISVPPQHGKSQGSSINVPAMMIGRNPNLKIATVCYSATKARKFGRKTKQLLSEESYNEVFGSLMADKGDTNYINTAEEIEMVGKDGSLKMVGYQGGLTGDPVDVLIMDDLYKDWKEANSPLIRENVTDWYVTVADTRLHNDSQQLIVFTRWHEGDLVGFIEKNETVILIESWSDIEKYKDQDVWFKINFEAIKLGKPTEIDPRVKNQPLWVKRHSLAKLQRSRSKDPIKFNSLYQGNPASKEGLLYGDEWRTYKTIPDNIIVRKNYTDTADKGDDYLCSIDYDEARDGSLYVVDITYTQESMEVTEPLVSSMMDRNNVRVSDVESNNGGRGFARKLAELTNSLCSVSWFHQSNNKESRIISNAATVKERIVFPEGWHVRWPEFYVHLTTFKRKFSANKHDDAEDTLTGMIEKSGNTMTTVVPTEDIYSGGGSCDWYNQ